MRLLGYLHTFESFARIWPELVARLGLSVVSVAVPGVSGLCPWRVRLAGHLHPRGPDWNFQPGMSPLADKSRRLMSPIGDISTVARHLPCEQARTHHGHGSDKPGTGFCAIAQPHARCHRRAFFAHVVSDAGTRRHRSAVIPLQGRTNWACCVP